MVPVDVVVKSERVYFWWRQGQGYVECPINIQIFMGGGC